MDDEDEETRRAAASLTQLKRMFRHRPGNEDDGPEGQVDDDELDEELDELEEELREERGR